MKKHFAPAANRNQDPILKMLQEVFSQMFGDYSGLKLLEVSSGTGQHAAHFAAAMPTVTYQPSEYSKSSLASVAAYVEEARLPNLLPPLLIDVSKDTTEWPCGPLSQDPLDVVLCINMVHIAPWYCGEGLFRAAGRLLRQGGLLVTYGPYACNGVITPDSNVNFDSGLRAQDPDWGLRDTNLMESEGLKHGLTHVAKYSLPANNHALVFRKQ